MQMSIVLIYMGSLLDLTLRSRRRKPRGGDWFPDPTTPYRGPRLARPLVYALHGMARHGDASLL